MGIIRQFFGVTEEKASQIASLSYAVRFRVIVAFLGTFLFVLSALSLIPIAVSLGAGEYSISLRYGLVVAGTLAVGLVMSHVGEIDQLQYNESIILSALMFLIAPLVMTYPMSAAGMPFIDTLFEAVSAATTTGLSTAPTMEGKPTTFLFSRAWMQWYGGLGIVFVSLALVVSPGLSAKRLSDADDAQQDLIGSTRAHVRWVLAVYLILTVVGIVAVWFASSQGFFNSVLYTFSAVSTGGFSPHDTSLAALDGRLSVTVITLVALGGAVSLVTYRRIYREGVHTLRGDRQLQVLLILCLVSVGALYVTVAAKGSLGAEEGLWHSFIMGLSAQSTTGFASLSLETFSPSSELVMIVSMMVGGCIGSTAGGLKIFRFMIAMRLVFFPIVRTAMPKDAVVKPRFGEHPLSDREFKNAVTIILLFVGVVMVSWFMFLLYGHPPMDSLFEVVSATGTVGLSSGLTGPELSPVLKLVLCADMLMGRLEIIAWLVFLYPRTWFGNRRAIDHHQP
jgi:trk system potassium uptake protein TrkH